jgi:hypothetical protein
VALGSYLSSMMGKISGKRCMVLAKKAEKLREKDAE